MKPKYILVGILVIAVVVVGYLAITCKMSEHPQGASIYALSATAKKSSLATVSPNSVSTNVASSQAVSLVSVSGIISRPIPAPIPGTQIACQSSGNIFSSPVTNATYDAGSYLPVDWRTSLPALPTNVSLSLVPLVGGSPILFSQYSTATGVTSNGTMSVSLTQGGDAAGIIPQSISAGQYYLQIQFTFAPGVLSGGALGFVTCSGTFTIAPAPICTPTFGYLSQWGSQGATNGQFSGPQSVAVDSSGNVYVTDAGNRRVQKFSSNGTYITKWGTQGSGNGQFAGTMGGIATNAGNIYVADSNNNRLEEFSSNGSYITKWGTAGSGNGQFRNPTGITISSSGNIYVVDSGNNRIEEFSSNGIYMTQWGTAGSGNGQFAGPEGIAIDSLGNIYVADADNQRIEKFSSNGTYITKWGTQGSGNGQFISPDDVAVDASGNVYVADTINDRIQKFSSNGIYISKWGMAGSTNGQFNIPLSLAVDASGNVYVVDYSNNRIQKFGLSSCALY